MVAAGDMASLKKALGLHASRGGDVVAVLEQAMDVDDADEGLYEAIRGRFTDKARWAQVLVAFEEGAEATGSDALRRQAARVKLYEMGDMEGALEIAKALDAEGAAAGLSREVADAKAASGGLLAPPPAGAGVSPRRPQRRGQGGGRLRAHRRGRPRPG
jgi:hypothetical protein